MNFYVLVNHKFPFKINIYLLKKNDKKMKNMVMFEIY